MTDPDLLSAVPPAAGDGPEWHVEILTPDGVELRSRAGLVELFTTDGQIGVMAGHQPLLVNLELGELALYEHGQRSVFLVSGGFARITPERLSILAFSLERTLDGPARQRCEARRTEFQN